MKKYSRHPIGYLLAVVVVVIAWSGVVYFNRSIAHDWIEEISYVGVLMIFIPSLWWWMDFMSQLLYRRQYRRKLKRLSEIYHADGALGQEADELATWIAEYEDYYYPIKKSEQKQ